MMRVILYLKAFVVLMLNISRLHIILLKEIQKDSSPQRRKPPRIDHSVRLLHFLMFPGDHFNLWVG